MIRFSRVLVILIAYAASVVVLAGACVLAALLINLGGSPPLRDLGLLFLIIVYWASLLSLAPSAMFIAIAEYRSIRRAGFFVSTACVTSLVGLSVFAWQVQIPWPGVGGLFVFLLLGLIAGCISGLVYWKIAGQNSGRREFAPT